MTVKEATHLIKASIKNNPEIREVNAITEWILEDLTGLKRVDRLLFDTELDSEQENKMNVYVQKLSNAVPVQYITGYAWFLGKKILVNEHVLIPRPETEELVEWALESVTAGKKAIDMGTGSGCIAVLLKQEKPDAEVFAIDVCRNALEVAQKNATAFGVEIQFLVHDILNLQSYSELPMFDIIISNPPYIPYLEKDTMDKQVVEYEPHLALFVPENDPLIFYKSILRLAETNLCKGGKIFFETHYALAKDVASLTTWPFEIRKDAFEKERMVCITKP